MLLRKFLTLVFVLVLASCAQQSLQQRKNPSSNQFIKSATETYNNKAVLRKKSTEAFEKIKKQARKGGMKNQLDLADSFSNGIDTKIDYKKAKFWYEKAEKKKSSVAQFRLGLMEELGHGTIRNYSKSAVWYKKAISNGNVGALFRLGLLYEKGFGVTRDINLAVLNFKNAAAKDYGPALNKLGLMHLNGENVVQDYKRALSFFDRAAKKGQAQAAYYIGLMNLEGKGITKNLNQAYFWFNVSSTLGHKEARKKLDEIVAQIDKSELGEIQIYVQNWLDQELEIDNN